MRNSARGAAPAPRRSSRARPNSAALYGAIQARAGDTHFLGYETTAAEGRVVAIVRDGMEFDELTGQGEAEVVLDRTPFYAEGGGQVGDQGVLREAGGGSELFTVTDTQRPLGGLIVQRGTLHGRLRVGETVDAVVDAERRAHTMRNHTGTHLLHRALRNVVGERARQAGSLVTPDYLRFDFPFDRGLTDDERRAIEDEVRRIIRDDRPVSIAFMTMGDAIEGGADAFFDEKYGETVRTIRVQDYSFELCGGTHCRATGQIGGFVITGERSIGSGMRRIEAVTGAAADALGRDRAAALDRVAEARRRPDRRRRRRADRGAPGRAARDEAAAQGRWRRPACPSPASSRRPRSRSRPGVRLASAAAGLRLDGHPQGRGPRPQRHPRLGRRRARARRRRAAAVRDRLGRSRRARDRGRRPGDRRRCPPSRAAAVAARRWPRVAAPGGTACPRPWRRSGAALENGA